jgi:hypothetical protein
MFCFSFFGTKCYRFKEREKGREREREREKETA